MMINNEQKNQTLPIKTMSINVGPQHPSTHGVLNFLIDLQGEKIKKVSCNMGFLHRGLEKMAQSRTFLQYLAIVDRVDYLSSFFCAQAFCNCVEELCEIEISRKAKYIRMLTMELNRISSHLLWLGTFLLDLGASSPFFYCFEAREDILKIFEQITGSRMMYNFFTFSGVKNDLSEKDIDDILNFLENFPSKLKDLLNLIEKNPIFLTRTKNIGIVSKSKALNYSISGANLRACDSSLDFRRAMPYLLYKDIDFNVITQRNGDCFSRFLVRVKEMGESAKIVRQCIEKLLTLKDEPFNNLSINDANICVSRKNGFAISYTEAPRGLLSCIVFANEGNTIPSRVKWRCSSFYALNLVEDILKDNELADLMSIFGSFDIIMPEVDR